MPKTNFLKYLLSSLICSSAMLASGLGWGPEYTLDYPETIPGRQFLQTTLRHEYLWREKDSDTATRITCTLDSTLPMGAYNLTLGEDFITMKAADQQGIFAAIGYLRRLVNGGILHLEADQSLSGDAASIDAQVEFPDRGMHLQLAFPHEYGLEYEQQSVKKFLRSMAEFGFNFVVLDLGGRYPFEKNPKASQYSAWSKEMIQDVCQYARSLGIEPVPGVNLIGHVERAPQVLIFNNEKGNPVGMDVLNKEFVSQYLDCMEEISQQFGSVKRIIIGTDECTEALDLLSKKYGVSQEEILINTVNRIGGALLEKDIEPIFWHDMLFKIKDLDLTKLDSRLTYDYWSYSTDDYQNLRALRPHVENIWVSPWFEAPAMHDLFSTAKELNISTILGTTWTWPGGVMTDLIHPALFAWNMDGIPGDSVGEFQQSFFNREIKRFDTLKSIPLTGGFPAPEAILAATGKQLDFQGWQCAFTTPRSPVSATASLEFLPINQLAELPPNTPLALAGPFRLSDGLIPDKVNVLCEPGEVSLSGVPLEVPEGCYSWEVAPDGTILGSGNKLPENGALLLWYGSDHPNANANIWKYYYIANNLYPQAKLRALRLHEPTAAEFSDEAITAEFPSGVTSAIAVLGVPFAKASAAGSPGTIRCNWNDGSMSELKLSGRVFEYGQTPEPGSPFQLYISVPNLDSNSQLSKVLILEITSPDLRKVKTVEFIPGPAAKVLSPALLAVCAIEQP